MIDDGVFLQLSVTYAAEEWPFHDDGLAMYGMENLQRLFIVFFDCSGFHDPFVLPDVVLALSIPFVVCELSERYC